MSEGNGPSTGHGTVVRATQAGGRRQEEKPAFPGHEMPDAQGAGEARACMWGSVAGAEEARAALMPLLFPLSIRTNTVTGISHLLNFFSKKKKRSLKFKTCLESSPRNVGFIQVRTE